MIVRQFGHGFVAGAVAAFAVLFIQGVALAQDDAAADEEFEEDGVEEIIVTGSRIRRRDFNAPSPITSIDSDQIRNSGQPNLEASLNQMPQVTPGLTRSVNNGSNGTAGINLRGLGSQRTLVMLNGRRMAASALAASFIWSDICWALTSVAWRVCSRPRISRFWAFRWAFSVWRSSTARAMS